MNRAAYAIETMPSGVFSALGPGLYPTRPRDGSDVPGRGVTAECLRPSNVLRRFPAGGAQHRSVEALA